MAELSDNLDVAEAQVREAIRAKWTGASAGDAGQVYTRERYSDNLNKYLDLITKKDTANANKTVIRAAFIKLRRIEPLADDASSCRTPQRLSYEIEVLYQFEDTRKDATNSTDGFNALLLKQVQAFGNDRDLGYTDLDHSGLRTVEDAEVSEFDKVLIHRTVFGLDCDIYQFN